MTTPAKTQMDDPDIHKGAIEGDKPADEQNVEKKSNGVDKDGTPNNPVAQAQDREGANADKSQG